MRPDLNYIIEKFDYYNNLCFEGKLKRPVIRLNTRKAALGLTRVVDKSIEISVRMDLPEEEYIDTLVHEMIHYYILSNNLVDDSPHGTLFKKIMNEITEKYGIKITINFDPTDEELVKTHTRPRFVCVASFDDGQVGLSVVAKNKLFQLWGIIPQLKGVEEARWYVSDRAIFGKFPVQVSPGFVVVDENKINHYLTGAKELENDGKVIKVK